MPFLTLLTRVHPARPNCLARCIASVKAQADQDLQHLLLRPEIEPNDVIKVGPLIHYAANQIEGRYIMQLPDDDRLRTPDFVKDLKAVIGTEDIDMVIHRMELGDPKHVITGTGICPPDDKWRERKIEPGFIAGQNGIIRREIYDGASHEWLRPDYGADFYYLQTAFGLSKKIIWWDYVGIESQGIEGNNSGKSEEFIQLKPRMET